MGPRDSRDWTEKNGNVQSAAKGKGKAKMSRNPSDVSLKDMTQEEVTVALDAVRQMLRILSFAQTYQEDIRDVEGVYGLGIRQQVQINELESMVTNLTSRKDQEMARLIEENDAYKSDVHQLELDRKELEREQAGINGERKALHLEMQRQKDEEISKAKQQLSERARAKCKQTKEDFEKKIGALEAENNRLKSAIIALEEKDKQAKKDLNEVKESSEIDKRSSQSHIKQVESELREFKTLSKFSSQTPQFYIDGFLQLSEGIRNVAFNGFISIPEDAKSLDSNDVRNQLSEASAIFKYPLLSSESPVSTFLRTHAIQNFMSAEIISIIQRRYYIEPTPAAKHESGKKHIDSILDTLSNVPAANPSQNLSWRITTIDKLDRLDPHGSPTTSSLSTRPDERDLTQAIFDKLHYFQGPSEHRLLNELTEIGHLATNLWCALRRDNCRVNFDYEPPTGERQGWQFVDYAATKSLNTGNANSERFVDILPLKSFVLFPRITGFFGANDTNPRILHAGLALSHDSPAFLEGLQEIEHIKRETKEFERRLRRKLGSQ